MENNMKISQTSSMESPLTKCGQGFKNKPEVFIKVHLKDVVGEFVDLDYRLLRIQHAV